VSVAVPGVGMGVAFSDTVIPVNKAINASQVNMFGRRNDFRPRLYLHMHFPSLRVSE
jgi:hypothetical protein